MRPTTAWESWVGGVLDLDHLGLGHLRRLVHLLHGVGGPLGRGLEEVAVHVHSGLVGRVPALLLDLPGVSALRRFE